MAGKLRGKSRVGQMGRAGIAAVVLLCVALATPVYAFASRVAHSANIPSYKAVSIRARCPAGQYVLFGGAQLNNANIRLLGMRRTADGAWTVDAEFRGGGVASPRVTSNAACGRGHQASKGYTSTRKAHGALYGSLESVTARCPRGTVVVGGGWTSTTGLYQNRWNAAMERVGVDELRVVVFISHGQHTTLTAIAYCRAARAPILVSRSIDVPRSKGAIARATCPQGTSLVFGGYIADDHLSTPSRPNDQVLLIPYVLKAESSTVWSVGARNWNTVRAGRLTALAYCG